MLIQPLLRRLVVIRGDGQNPVNAAFRKLSRQCNHFRGVVSARATEHRHVALDYFNGDLYHAQVLFMRQRRTLAGGPAGHQKIDPCTNLPLD